LLAEIINSINWMHCFREGNGRTQRAVACSLTREKGYRLELNQDKESQTYKRYFAGTVEQDNDILSNIIFESLRPNLFLNKKDMQRNLIQIPIIIAFEIEHKKIELQKEDILARFMFLLKKLPTEYLITISEKDYNTLRISVAESTNINQKTIGYLLDMDKYSRGLLKEMPTPPNTNAKTTKQTKTTSQDPNNNRTDP
jgi:hypothetical protein